MASKTGQCPPLATDQHNIITAENVNSLSPSTFNTNNGTVVNIKCYASTYKLVGSPQVTCVNGNWTPAPPTCVYSDKSPTPVTSTNTTGPAYSSDADTQQAVLIITSTICAAVLAFLLALLIYKIYIWRCKSRKDKHTFNSSPLPLYTTTSGSTVLQSTWPGSPRAWTYLSVDRLLTDIERSRKENPHHSWRDFASISSYSTTR